MNQEQAVSLLTIEQRRANWRQHWREYWGWAAEWERRGYLWPYVMLIKHDYFGSHEDHGDGCHGGFVRS